MNKFFTVLLFAVFFTIVDLIVYVGCLFIVREEINGVFTWIGFVVSNAIKTLILYAGVDK